MTNPHYTAGVWTCSPHGDGQVVKTAQSVLSAVQGHLLQSSKVCRVGSRRCSWGGKGRENTECVPRSLCADRRAEFAAGGAALRRGVRGTKPRRSVGPSDRPKQPLNYPPLRRARSFQPPCDDVCMHANLALQQQQQQ